MGEPTEKLAMAGVPEPAPAPPPKLNRGWFKAGDGRINRGGRPRGSKATVPAGTHPADCAPRADRLKRLVLDEPVLAGSLACAKAPLVINLPDDFRVVGCRFDAERQRAVLVLRSATFPRVAKGALIPKFEPQFRHLMWIKRRGVSGIFPVR
jgi:hypothetical protein